MSSFYPTIFIWSPALFRRFIHTYICLDRPWNNRSCSYWSVVQGSGWANHIVHCLIHLRHFGHFNSIQNLTGATLLSNNALKWCSCRGPSSPHAPCVLWSTTYATDFSLKNVLYITFRHIFILCQMMGWFGQYLFPDKHISTSNFAVSQTLQHVQKLLSALNESEGFC